MTGIVGGTAARPTIDAMLDSLYQEEWYETDRYSIEGVGVGIAHHGEKDPQSDVIWRGDRVLGAIHGVVSNVDDLELTTGELFRAVADAPDDVLPKLEGPFAIAVMDRETGTIRVATDKAGSRPCYYVSQKGFYFGSELTPLLEHIASPTVDRRAVSDLLLVGSVLGEKTLIEGIRNLPPATLLTYDGGEVETTRYWSPAFGENSHEDYVDGWIRRYQNAIDDLVGTVDTRTGLWLSGGIDSRVTGAMLRRSGADFETLTYENGLPGDNEVAPRVADNLGSKHRQITGATGSADEFIESIERCIDCNDAMQSWAYVPALSFMYHDLADAVDVVMEGGTFLGEDVWSYYLENDVPPAELLYHKRKQLPADEVDSLVPSVDDPRKSFREEVTQLDARGNARQSCDAVRRLYSYLHMRSNVVQRSQVGTRAVSDGAMLNHVLDMPSEQRMQTIPWTNGKIPLGAPPIKLRVTRELDAGLDEISYQRTGVAPARSYWIHAAAFIGKQLARRLTTDSAGPYITRYRENERVQSFIDGLVDDACRRPFLDADGIDTLRDRVRSGASANLIPLAAITGLERWLQQHVDPLRQSRESRPASVSVR
ncbi:asparagine synthase-related protein [Natrinema sp. 1APR25-10V2]|uniref:asparagine synthase-related protein n=1 Tax=Natrinema sp. 1APR25-10V2 TaxID=2951081 RepID=UPI002874D922|nr:asparagine synthase-related protein [Natrinema sp. 1APR25-10V2]MDS0475112.1 asparagine synthase-related protein [Natrinema sp. 1APR25-10V2]